MEIYEGNEQYIFVSYAHRDSDTVVPIIRALQENGFRVWYDQGIQAGTEWPAYIEDHLNRCSRFIVFMTASTVESVNCRNEINYAAMLKKEMLVVYLEKTTLAYGLNLQLNSKQSLYKYRHAQDSSFLRELLHANILRCCKVGEDTAPDPFSSASAPRAESVSHTTFDPESKERQDTLLSHAGGEYTIARVGSIGAKEASNLWPTGEYSHTVSLKHFSAVQFHCSLITPQRKNEKRTVNIRIYDANDALVFENQVVVSFAVGNDKFAISWVIRDEGGLAQEAGKYTALIWIDNSRVVEHAFRLASDEAAACAPSKEIKRLEGRLNAPKLLLWHFISWLIYSFFFSSVAAEAGFPTFLFGVLSLVVTILYFKQTRKLAKYGWFLTFILLFIVSPYYGIYLIVMSILAIVYRKTWKAKLAQLYDEA